MEIDQVDQAGPQPTSPLIVPAPLIPELPIKSVVVSLPIPSQARPRTESVEPEMEAEAVVAGAEGAMDTEETLNDGNMRIEEDAESVEDAEDAGVMEVADDAEAKEVTSDAEESGQSQSSCTNRSAS
jgi:hypothetical protein